MTFRDKLIESAAAALANRKGAAPRDWLSPEWVADARVVVDATVARMSELADQMIEDGKLDGITSRYIAKSLMFTVATEAGRRS